MDVRKLEAFCKVYEFQSFSKAGEDMYLSQPTISSHVANLEEELDVKLFDRLGRSVLPTRAGEVLYERAVVIFENLERAQASIEELRDRVVGDLQVGCSTIPSHNILPELVAGFSNKYPDVTFTVHTGDSSEVIKRVLSGEWPVGIVGVEPKEVELDARLLTEDETLVVASSDAPWLKHGRKDQVALNEAATLPWIMREKGSATRKALETALMDADQGSLGLNVRCQVEGTCEGLAHAVSGVGLCYTSRLAARSFIEKGELVQVHIPELEGRRQFYLIHHAGRHKFPALKAFIEFNS